MKTEEIKNRLKEITKMDWQIISVSMNGVDECYYSAPDGQTIQCHLIEKYIEVQENCKNIDNKISEYYHNKLLNDMPIKSSAFQKWNKK